jgi:hypothetical protein
VTDTISGTKRMAILQLLCAVAVFSSQLVLSSAQGCGGSCDDATGDLTFEVSVTVSNRSCKSSVIHVLQLFWRDTPRFWPKHDLYTISSLRCANVAVSLANRCEHTFDHS